MGTVNSKILEAGVHDVGIQWGLFVIAAALKTEKFYDLAGSGTFVYLVLKTLCSGGTYFMRQIIATAFVVMWGSRLGLFLFYRILQDGTDRRFNGVRDNPSRFFFYWTIQALWVFVTLLPVMILNTTEKDQPLQISDYAGAGLWLLGFAVETTADFQKLIFRSDPANAKSFIRSGLWSLSRHPNYLGEIMMWSGLWLTSSTVMTGAAKYATALCPGFVAFLLCRVSGIPLLEKAADKKWADNAKYLAYKKKTAVLVPFLW